MQTRVCMRVLSHAICFLPCAMKRALSCSKLSNLSCASLRVGCVCMSVCGERARLPAVKEQVFKICDSGSCYKGQSRSTIARLPRQKTEREREGHMRVCETPTVFYDSGAHVSSSSTATCHYFLDMLTCQPRPTHVLTFALFFFSYWLLVGLTPMNLFVALKMSN